MCPIINTLIDVRTHRIEIIRNYSRIFFPLNTCDFCLAVYNISSVYPRWLYNNITDGQNETTLG